MRPDAKQRAYAFVTHARTPRAVAGQGGDRTTFTIACALAVDFALDDGDVRDLLEVYNRAKCDPQWAERDIDRFVRSARRTAAGKPGEVGKALGVDRKEYTGPSSPAATASKPPQPKPAGGYPSHPQEAARTPRTPVFKVTRAGEGAEPRTARTLRTDFLNYFSYSSTPPPLPVNEERRESVREVRQETKAAAPRELLDRTIIWEDGDVWKADAGKPWLQKQRPGGKGTALPKQ